MTYLELVTFIESIVNLPRNKETIDKFNNLDIELEGDRYFRFIDRITYLIQERLNAKYKSIVSKIETSNMDSNTFNIEFNEFMSEVEYLKMICSTKKIKPENTTVFLDSIKKSKNNILNNIKQYFIDIPENQIIFSLINETVKEDIKNEL